MKYFHMQNYPQFIKFNVSNIEHPVVHVKLDL